MLIDCVEVTGTEALMEHDVCPDPPVIVHERAVAAAVPPVMMSTVAVWFVPFVPTIVKVNLVKVVPVPGV